MKGDDLLVAHHQVLRSLLHQLEGTDPSEPDVRRRLLDSFTTEISIHAQIEDQIFYPAVRDVSPLVGVAHAEHRQIEDQLAVLLRTDVGSEDFADEVRVLRATLEHHAGEEETQMFPQSHALGDAALEELGMRMASRQEHLRRSALTRLRVHVKRETLRRLRW
jgi:hemerythrin-like domain-containing protein